MKKFTRITAAILLIVSMLITVIPFSVEVSAATLVYSKESNSGKRGDICTTLEGTSASSYYTGSYTYDALDDLSSSAIFSALQTLMRDTHSYLSKYSDCHYKADKTDCEQNNGKVTLIYTSYQATMQQWNGWNREHVWPKSLGGGDDKDKTGGADMHHIRPSDAGVNSSRGNKKYGYSNGGSEKKGTNPAVGILGGTYNSTYFEPLDCVKGDVARICLYVYVRWNSEWGASKITSVFESVDVLLEWCALDPVDTWEMGRNEVIGEMQGNRNVFIDYPEYAWLIFGREVPENMTTPSSGASNGGSSSGGSSSGGDSSCKHTSTEIKDKVSANCGKDGYSGDTYCKDCGEKLSNGTAVKATGEHTYGDWTSSNGTETRTCSVCGSVESKNCSHKDTEVRNAVSAGCGKDGYSGDTYCKNCNAKTSTGTVIKATGEHTYGDWTMSNGTETRTCSVCGSVESKNCDHKNTEVRNAVSANCVDEGYSGDTYCKDCNAKVSTGTKISATGQHSFGEWEEMGDRQERTCSVCEMTEEKPLDACTHSATEVKDKASATCGKDGYSGDTYCKDCGEKISSGSKTAATGEHNFGGWETQGDRQERTCTVCGKTEERELEQCNHSATEIKGELAPTCNEKGYTGDTCCAECETIITPGTEIPATGDHKNTELRDVLDETCCSEGYTGDLYCTDCGSKIGDGEIIPVSDKHANTVLKNKKNAAKNKAGYSGDIYCDDCQTVILKGGKIPPTEKTNAVQIVLIVVSVLAFAGAVTLVTLAVINVNKKKAK